MCIVTPNPEIQAHGQIKERKSITIINSNTPTAPIHAKGSSHWSYGRSGPRIHYCPEQAQLV
jgi:hypothetical protein